MAQRRLAAIMFTDIVGYDSLLKEDEKKAFEQLRFNQRIQKRLIKKFKGRWLKEIESGTLASFASNIDAVMCSLSIQKASEELEIPLRIGIHEGDVIFEKRDVLGDGVNITSRIQNAVNTSGIVISERVYDDIKNKEGLDVEFLGEHNLKGVESPVNIYSVSCKNESVLDFSIDTGELVRPYSFGSSSIVIGIMIIALLAYAIYYFLPKTDFSDEPEKSILVLPFENFLDSDTLDYFVAGMHDALIGNIGKISALQVISRTTANAYKNSEKTIPEIAAELGVNAIVEASVLYKGDSISLEVRLVSTDEDEEQPWVKEYHEEASQILRLYNTITKEISDEIDVNLRPQEEMFLAESNTVDPDAYDAYLQGRLKLDEFNPQSFLTAIDFFNKAIEIDPDWPAPYAGIAEAGAYQNQRGWGSRSDNIIMIYKNLNKAQELDPNSFYLHYTNAVIAVWTEFDWEKGEREFKKAIELNPSHVRCRSFYAHLLSILRKTDDAVYQAKKTLELQPNNPLTLVLYNMVLFMNDECEEALARIEKELSVQPDHLVSNQLWGALECAGEFDRVFEMWKEMNIKMWEEYGLTEKYEKIFQEYGWIAVNKEAIRVTEELLVNTVYYDSTSLFYKYMLVGEHNKAMDFLEKWYEKDKYSPMMPYSSVKSTYNKMKDNPRYIELLKKMNLPLL